MSGDVFQYTVAVSKKAADLVRAGKATFNSGGVRALDGTLVELAKPAFLPVANPSNPNPLSICAREFARNQRDLQNISRNLNVSMQQMQQLSTSLESLSMIQTLNWANCALGVMNSAISIAGTMITLQRIDSLSHQIGQLQNMIEEAIIRERTEKALTYLGYIRNDLQLLGSPNMHRSEMINIPDHIAQIYGFLKVNIDSLQNETVDHIEALTTMIFNLVFPYSELIRLYTTRYYYFNSDIPSQYENWLSILNEIDSDDFRDLLKTYLELYRFDLSTEEKIQQFSGVIQAIRYQIGLMNFQLEMIYRFSYQDYLNMDQLVENKIKKGNFQATDNNLYIEMKPDTSGFSFLKKAFSFIRE